jgi:hypothetical protein
MTVYAFRVNDMNRRVCSARPVACAGCTGMKKLASEERT